MANGNTLNDWENVRAALPRSAAGNAQLQAAFDAFIASLAAPGSEDIASALNDLINEATEAAAVSEAGSFKGEKGDKEQHDGDKGKEKEPTEAEKLGEEFARGFRRGLARGGAPWHGPHPHGHGPEHHAPPRPFPPGPPSPPPPPPPHHWGGAWPWFRHPHPPHRHHQPHFEHGPGGPHRHRHGPGVHHARRGRSPSPERGPRRGRHTRFESEEEVYSGDERYWR